MTQNLCILGSTGSIGCSTLDVVELHKDQYQVLVLTAHTNSEKLFLQCLKFKPQLAILKNPDDAKALQARLQQENIATQVSSGVDDLNAAASLQYQSGIKEFYVLVFVVLKCHQ